jgi:hypothetical protein
VVLEEPEVQEAPAALIKKQVELVRWVLRARLVSQAV